MRTQTIGDRIRAHRKERGWSQSELARRTGLESATISRAELAKVTPESSTLLAIAHALGVEMADLTGDPSRQPTVAEFAELREEQRKTKAELRELRKEMQIIRTNLGDVAVLRQQHSRPPTPPPQQGGPERQPKR